MNFSKIISAGLLTAFFFTASAFTFFQEPVSKSTPWEIDRAHSNISFKITHFFTPVQGTFGEYESEIYFSPDNLEESSINIDILASSINTNNNRRDGHLKSPDFFNVQKYPNISFSSNKITAEGDNRFTAHGKLTVKDVSRDIKLPFTLLGVLDHPQKQNTKVAGISIDYAINRTDYGVGVGDWAATAVVGDNVDISIALELNSVN